MNSRFSPKDDEDDYEHDNDEATMIRSMNKSNEDECPHLLWMTTTSTTSTSLTSLSEVSFDAGGGYWKRAPKRSKIFNDPINYTSTKK